MRATELCADQPGRRREKEISVAYCVRASGAALMSTKICLTISDSRTGPMPSAKREPSGCVKIGCPQCKGSGAAAARWPRIPYNGELVGRQKDEKHDGCVRRFLTIRSGQLISMPQLREEPCDECTELGPTCHFLIQRN